jgi:hypothetical protein
MSLKTTSARCSGGGLERLDQGLDGLQKLPANDLMQWKLRGVNAGYPA